MAAQPTTTCDHTRPNSVLSDTPVPAPEQWYRHPHHRVHEHGRARRMAVARIKK